MAIDLTDDHSPTLEHHPLDASTEADPRGGAIAVGRRPIDWRQATGAGCIGFGAVGILISWFQIANTTEVWKQLPYLSSGGIGGAALIAVGITILIGYEHVADREALHSLVERLDKLDRRLDRALVSDSEVGSRLDDLDRSSLLERIAALEATLAPPSPTTSRRANGATARRRA